MTYLPLAALALVATTPDLVEFPTPVVVQHPEPAGRRLRGDWESPRALLVTFNDFWPRSLNAILEAADAARTPVVVLRERTARKDALQMLVQARHKNGLATAVLPFEVDTPWIRDFGPLEVFEYNGRIVWLDAAYAPDSRPNDDRLPSALAAHFAIPMEGVPEEIEGGAFASNGRGFCVSTVEAFGAAGFDVEEPDSLQPLMQQLGCRTLVLGPALERDETKHADMFVQFLSPNLAAVASMNASDHPADAQRLDATVDALRAAAKQAGMALEIVRVEMVADVGGLYFTYVNGLRLYGSFLVPSYEGVAPAVERRAYAALRKALPSVRLVPIPADDLIELLGAVHCATLGVSAPPPVENPLQLAKLRSVAKQRTSSP